MATCAAWIAPTARGRTTDISALRPGTWHCTTRTCPPPPGGAGACARAYGSRISDLLDGGSLGAQIAPGLYEAELGFLHEHEWARSADDVLWRRGKLGLHYNDMVRTAVAEWCHRHWGAGAATATAAATERTWN